MAQKNQDIIDDAKRLEDYARDKKTLKGFVPKIPIFGGQPPSGSSALQGMSIEQLQDMLKNAKPSR